MALALILTVIPYFLEWHVVGYYQLNDSSVIFIKGTFFVRLVQENLIIENREKATTLKNYWRVVAFQLKMGNKKSVYQYTLIIFFL